MQIVAVIGGDDENGFFPVAVLVNPVGNDFDRYVSTVDRAD